MKYFYILILLFILSFSVFAQTYKNVKIYINNKGDIETLSKAGLEIDHLFYDKEDNSIEVLLDDKEFSKLDSSGFKFEILISDWKKYYNSLPQLNEASRKTELAKTKDAYGVSGFSFGSMGGFYTLDEVNAQLDSLKKHFPNLITAKQSIGNTTENRPIYMVKISGNAATDGNQPEVLYTALHHAREPEGMQQLFYFMYYLLENYNSNPAVKYLVDHRELYFIPVVNPDGYEYNHVTDPHGGGLWRKNRRNNNDGQYGVDLNRNYGPRNYWEAPNGGSSTYTSEETYRGSAPFSEPETQAVKNFLASHHFKLALNYHTFGNYLIYPYGALVHETPDSLKFREFASDMTLYNKYTFGTDEQTVNYSTRGNSDDYFYDGNISANGGKILAMSPEVGNNFDLFWPSQNRIIPLAEENLYPNLYYAWAAGEYIRLDNLNLNKSFVRPGETVQIFPTFKNKGFQDASNILIRLSSLSQFCTVNLDSVNINSISNFSNASAVLPFSFTINSQAPLKQDIKLLFTSNLEGVEISSDTVTIKVDGSVLPVELTSFNVFAGKNNITLNWKTASEVNNLGFEIERSSLSPAPSQREGGSNSPSLGREEGVGWFSIGFAKGKGTTTDLSSYTFIDKNPLQGKSLYRLKQIDYNGSFDYSQSVEAGFADNFNLEQNYPNPFNSTTYIFYSLSIPEQIIIKVYDILGNEVTTLVNEIMQPGFYKVEFDGSRFSSGVYYYTLRAGSIILTKKLLLLK